MSRITTCYSARAATERIVSYDIPAFKQDRVFIYCAAYRKHIGIYPPVRDDTKLQAALQPYANAKGNLSFPMNEPMPSAFFVRVATAPEIRLTVAVQKTKAFI